MPRCRRPARRSLLHNVPTWVTFPHHADGGLYECALLLREEEESEEEKRRRKTPSSSSSLPQHRVFTDLQHRNGRGEMGWTWENLKKRGKREKREKTGNWWNLMKFSKLTKLSTFPPNGTHFEGKKVVLEQCFQPSGEFLDFGEISLNSRNLMKFSTFSRKTHFSRIIEIINFFGPF